LLLFYAPEKNIRGILQGARKKSEAGYTVLTNATKLLIFISVPLKATKLHIMKIAFVGKGGSGKTTTCSLVARFLASKKLPVLAIDGDINQHLGEALGFTANEALNIPPLGIEILKIKEYLRGENQNIKNPKEMIKTTPPGPGSRLLRVQETNPLYRYFSKTMGGVRLMVVGPFTEEDLGVRCYHSKTGSIELLLNHMIDKENEYVLVDMTAGADSFSSGLFTRFDVTFLVVEPTLKSLSVYTQYKSYAKEFGVVLKVIGNKIEDKEDIAFIQGVVGDDLVATFSKSSFIKQADRGVILPLEELEEENREALQQIREVIDSQEKNWKKFYDQAVYFHKKNASSWANEEMGKNLLEQIDPKFELMP
jgi:CO dehydrogenase maturation factor